MPRPLSDKTRRIREAAQELGITQKALENRIARRGITVEEAIAEGGPAKRGPKYQHDWSALDRLGVTKCAVCVRAKVSGLTVDEILAGKTKPRPKPPGKLYYGPNGRITLDLTMIEDKRSS